VQKPTKKLKPQLIL